MIEITLNSQNDIYTQSIKPILLDKFKVNKNEKIKYQLYRIRTFYKILKDQSKTTMLQAHNVPVSKDQSPPSKVSSKIAITITTCENVLLVLKTPGTFFFLYFFQMNEQQPTLPIYYQQIVTNIHGRKQNALVIHHIGLACTMLQFFQRLLQLFYLRYTQF